MNSSKTYSFGIGLWKGVKWALVLALAGLATAGLTDVTVKDIVLYVLDGSGAATLSVGALLTIAINFATFRAER